MKTVPSEDGTRIAFDRLGDGRPVIVVGGAMCDRALTRPTAEELAKHFAVFNYDRRGRGDSGDRKPYALKREIEDIGALIAEAGRGEPRLDDRRGQAGRGRAAERTAQGPGGPGTRRAPGVLVPVLAGFFAD